MNYSRRIGDKIGFNVSYRFSEVTHDYPRAGYTWNFGTNGATPSNPFLSSFQMYDEQKITHRESLSVKLDYFVTPNTKVTLTGQWNWYDLTFNGRSINYNITGAPAAGFTQNSVTSTPGAGTVTTDLSQRNKYGRRICWERSSPTISCMANCGAATRGPRQRTSIAIRPMVFTPG